MKRKQDDEMTDKQWCVYALVCLLIAAGMLSLTFVV